VNRRFRRQALKNRAWHEKVLNEAQLLHAVGHLRSDGEVVCPECGSVVVRSTGWRMVFACSCGWRLEDFELDE
jgi:hypothetical protein